MTLREYLEDYASAGTRKLGMDVIARELKLIPSDKVKRITEERLGEIALGKRDFRF
jgi:2-iminoacetate synthase